MDFLHEVTDQARRVTVDLLNGGSIERDAPWSPEVPEHLRHDMPDLFDRFPIVYPWEQPSPVDPALHNVWLLDNTAYRVQDAWEVEFVAAYFIKNGGKDVSKVVAAIAAKLDVRADDVATRKRIAQRLQPFVDPVLPNRTVQVTVGEQQRLTLGPSSHSGISSQIEMLDMQPSSALLQNHPLNLPPPFSLPSTTVLAHEEGWGVISDIDDSIKVTQTPSPLGILTQTFVVETPQPIAGMPELYAHIYRTLTASPLGGEGQPPNYFYLSASPYNLYPFLKQFRDAHYPQGTIILRDSSWQNLGGLIASLNQGTQDYKTDRVSKIHGWFPRRKMICVGDSTQSDPEAYGECARKFPGWIKAIYIRKVTDIAEMNIKEKNAPERFEKAFRGLDKSLWHVFTEPGELAERVDMLAPASSQPGAVA